MPKTIEEAAKELRFHNLSHGGFGDGANAFTASAILAIIYGVTKEKALDVLVTY